MRCRPMHRFAMLQGKMHFSSMNRRSLSIIALLVLVFALADAWGKSTAAFIPLVAQTGEGRGNRCKIHADYPWGDCIQGDGCQKCIEEDPNEFWDGYCYPSECPPPTSCPDGQSGIWPYCMCDNGGDPYNGCQTDPCSQPGAYETNPDCNECLKGSCSDEDKCSGVCTGSNERCQGINISEEERADLCDCRNVEGPDDFCKTNGIGFQYPDNAPGEQGKYCDSNCKVTQCSDGIDNDEYEGDDRNAGKSYKDGSADKKDLGCYCEECWLADEKSEYDPTKNSEYDRCGDKTAPPWEPTYGQDIILAAADPSRGWWARLFALISPLEERLDPKIPHCAFDGKLALQKEGERDNLILNDGFNEKKGYQFLGMPMKEKAADIRCVGCLSVPNPGVSPEIQAMMQGINGKYANLVRDMTKNIPNFDVLPVKNQVNLRQKISDDLQIERMQELFKMQRREQESWCSQECENPKLWEKNGISGNIPAAAKRMCDLNCFCLNVDRPYELFIDSNGDYSNNNEDIPGYNNDMKTSIKNQARKLAIDRKHMKRGQNLMDDHNECFARCYYDIDTSHHGNEEECAAVCKSNFCPQPEINLRSVASGRGFRGSLPGSTTGVGGKKVSGKRANGSECDGSGWAGVGGDCYYDLCTIMSWYRLDCGFNFPSIPNIAGGAGGGGGGGQGGTGGTGRSVPAAPITGGGPGAGGGGGGSGGTGAAVSAGSSTGSTVGGRQGSGNAGSSGVSSSMSSSRASSAGFGSSRFSIVSMASSAFSTSTSRASISLFTSSSSKSSDGSSSRSSLRFSSYSSYLQVLACPPDACGANGNAGNTFCSRQGMTCFASNVIPCIRCIEGEFDTSSYGSIPFGASSFPSTPLLSCGNGRVDTGEECDDGNLSNFDTCTTACRRVQKSSVQAFSSSSSRDLFALRFCGNGVLNEGEDCDIGAQNSDLPNASCRSDCSLTRCGDQVVDGIRGEQCDDGNGIDGDGCSSSCALEQFAGNPSSAAVLPGSLIELPFVPGSPNQPRVLPNVPAHGPVGDTGPEAIAIMAAGASAGYTWMKMRRAKK